MSMCISTAQARTKCGPQIASASFFVASAVLCRFLGEDCWPQLCWRPCLTIFWNSLRYPGMRSWWVDIALLLVPKEGPAAALTMIMSNLICYYSIATSACIWYIDYLPPILFGVSCRCVFWLFLFSWGWFKGLQLLILPYLADSKLRLNPPCQGLSCLNEAGLNSKSCCALCFTMVHEKLISAS